jgi:tRNA(Ile)-lysidine synthetase-like protein
LGHITTTNKTDITIYCTCHNHLRHLPDYKNKKLNLVAILLGVGQWPLKKAIQEAHILPWLRHTIQILVIDNVMLLNCFF